MIYERVVEEIITEFLPNTCQMRPQISESAVQAAMLCVDTAAHHPNDEAEADLIPLITGSVAEFYIEPMLPHVGDVDVMHHWSTELAIPRGHPPPTQLPAEFHNCVKVLEIIDSHLPGYVYLKLRYLLTECVDEDTYKAVEYDEEVYAKNHLYSGDKFNIHGPAVMIFQSGLLSFDAVRCMRCLSWPSQAPDWPSRHREYGWPDSATVDCVVNNGCDVVGVAHRLCRQHEWMGKRQWRLSFSRAEIVLLNSWMPVQQIVYHMLRVFAKTERLTDSANNSDAATLSNYHIKTVMLWACELKPRSWWTDDLSLVKICVELLHDLAVCLIEVRCPHYFINKCNLVDSSYNLEMIPSRLTSISNWWLSSWFVHNYIRRCSQLCPHNVSRLFDDVSTTTKLQNAVSEIVDWKQNNIIYDRLRVHEFAFYHITYWVYTNSLTVCSSYCWLNVLRNLSASLSIHFSSVAFLHAAYRITRIGLNDELMDVLAVLVGQPRRYSCRRRSVLFLSNAVSLMKAVDDRPESRSTVQLIEIELSKAYLYRALRCKDSDSDSIYCLANVYLAFLHYTTGQYQTAIDHCRLVTRSQDHSQCSSHVVQGELLPKIDDDIDNVLGLSVFYQYTRTAALNQRQTHITVFTTELFAHYLHIKCLSVTKCQQLSDTTKSLSSTYEFQSHVKYIRPTDAHQMFIADVLLWKLVSGFYGQKFLYMQQAISRQYPTEYPSELSTSDLVELLQKSAVEHLTTLRQIEAREFGSVATIVTTVFEAMYAYKHGDYQQCLQLSTQNVHALLNAVRMADVPAFPEFIQFLDDDIVSLTALTLIVNPECRVDDRRYVCVIQLTLSLYLMIQCQLKLRQSVTSLAQTLVYIEATHRRHPVKRTLDRLVLKMITRKTLIRLATMT